MKTKLQFSTVVVLLFALTPLAYAQQSTVDIPRTLSYQGVLQPGAGTSATGNQLMTVRLYGDPDGTHLVWEDTFTVTVQNGVFNLLLGSQKPLPGAAQMDVPLWVAVKIGEAAEMKPYASLSASPYALTVANGSITSEKISADYVSSISVNGTKVTGNGSNVNLMAGDGLKLNYDPTSSAIWLSTTGNANTSGKGATPLSSDNYIINETSQQSSANFNISGSGVIGTTLSVGGNASIGGTASVTGNTSLSGNLTVSGSTALHGALDMNSHQVHNVTDPTSAQDAATKNYVDNGIAALANNLFVPAMGTGCSTNRSTILNNVTTTNSWVGCYNTGHGYDALSMGILVTGRDNTADGANALLENQSGNWNTALGSNALYTNVSGGNNVAVGLDALFTNTAGNNTAVGVHALLSNTTGTPNTAVGIDALYNNTTGANNTAVGADALINYAAGNYNSAFGTGAGENAGSAPGSYNSFFGYMAGAGDNTTTGYANTFLGNEAGFRNTDGHWNTFVGNAAGFANTSGTYDVFIGNAAGLDNTLGDFNTFEGYAAGESNTIGTLNTFVGLAAGLHNISGEQNSFFGLNSGYYSTGSQNTFVGEESGEGLSSGYGNSGESYNTLLGFQSDIGQAGITNATAIGEGAVVGASNTVQLGNSSVTLVNTSGNVQFSGSLMPAGFPGTPGQVLVSSGGPGIAPTWQDLCPLVINCVASSGIAWELTGNAISSGNFLGTTNAQDLVFKTNGAEQMRILSGGNVGIGTPTPTQALDVNGQVRIENLPAATDNNLVTADGSGNLHERSASALVGANAWSLTGNAGTTYGTNFIGTTDGQSLLFKVNGQKSGMIEFSGNYNTGMGYQVLQSATGLENTASGVYALRANTTGELNTASGGEALRSNTTGNYNTASGAAALSHNTTGWYNTACGEQALVNNSTGWNNTATGYNTLLSNYSGSNITAVGSGADVSVDGLTNATAIGANAVVSQSNSLVLGHNANVGIGTSTPQSDLEVAGNGTVTLTARSSDPATPNSGTWKIYVFDNGTTRELRVKGPSGTVNTISTLTP